MRTLVAILSCAVCFAGLALLGSRTLDDLRVDVSSSGVHTPSPGALEIAASLERPVRLTLFYSSDVASNLPEVVVHAERVRRVLRTLEEAGGGRLIINEVDPAPFSAGEDRAANAGIAQVQTRFGTLYFGLAGSNDLDDAQGISYFDPALESRLEYDIARTVWLLSRSVKPRVGVYSSLPLKGELQSSGMLDRPWAIYNELGRVFELIEIQEDAELLPGDLDALLVVHPKDVPEDLRYAIDQGVLGGLPAVVVVDPNCEADRPASVRENPRLLADYRVSSGLPEMFASWGVRVPGDRVVGDRENARSVRTRRGDETVDVDFLPYFAIGEKGFTPDVRSTERLELLHFVMSGYVETLPDATTTVTPLVSTSDDAMLILVTRDLRFRPNPQGLLRSFAPTGERYPLVVSIEGEAASSFQRLGRNGHLAGGTVRASVIADADLLSDALWIEPRMVGGERVGAVRTADNAELLIGLLAEHVASDALLSITPRERGVRRFETVATMRREAQQRFSVEEDRLRDELERAELRLNQLGAQREASGSFLIEDQRAELLRVQAQRAEVRRQLRDIQFELDRDIEALGTRVKLINILGVPALVVVVALGIAGRRRLAQRAERHAQRGGAS